MITYNPFLGTPTKLDKTGTTMRLLTSVPATPASTGKLGQLAVDDDYLYVCIAANSWVRIARDSWVEKIIFDGEDVEFDGETLYEEA